MDIYEEVTGNGYAVDALRYSILLKKRVSNDVWVFG